MKFARATIRFSVFFTISFAIYGVWIVGNLIIPNRTYWRQIAFYYWSRLFVKISAMEASIIGEKPKPPFLLVANHLSYIDIPLLRSIIECVFVAKGDIEDWTIAGRMVRDMGNIFVDRNNRRDIPRAGKKILEKLDQGEGVIVFPEGTSSKGERVLPFNSSFFEFATKKGIPVHYAAISYQTDQDEDLASEKICWWDDTPFIVHAWNFFALPKSKAIINFGSEPITNADRKVLAKNLWKNVNSVFIPTI